MVIFELKVVIKWKLFLLLLTQNLFKSIVFHSNATKTDGIFKLKVFKLNSYYVHIALRNY